MPIGHPNVKNAYVVHEGRFFAHPWHMVLVVETDLPTNPHHPKFSQHALNDLMNAVQSYMVEHYRQQVEGFKLVPTNDPI